MILILINALLLSVCVFIAGFLLGRSFRAPCTCEITTRFRDGEKLLRPHLDEEQQAALRLQFVEELLNKLNSQEGTASADDGAPADQKD